MRGKDAYAKVWDDAGLFMLWTVIADYCVTVAGLAAGLTVSWWQFPVSLVVSALLTVRRGRGGWRGAAAGVMLIAAVMVASAALPDLSYDGNAYHKDSAAWPLGGWNPLLDAAPPAMLWVLHYPIGAELTGATVAALTGCLEAAKCICPILAVSALLGLRGALDRWLPDTSRGWKWLVVAVAGLNPVVLFQFPTFCIDSATYSLVLWTVLLFMAEACGGSARNEAALCGAAVLAAGIKWTTVFFTGYAWLAALGWFLYRRRWRLSGRVVLTGVLALVLGVVVLGWHPYVSNWMEAGHPLYPLMGEGKIDIMTDLTPDVFRGHGRVYNFFANVGDSRIRMMQENSTPGGFGPFMAVQLVLSLVLMAAGGRKVPAVGRYVYVMTLASCFIFEESWWARYIPQLWMLLPVGIVSAMRAGQHRGMVRATAVAVALLCLPATAIWGYRIMTRSVAMRGAIDIYMSRYRGETVRGYYIDSDHSGVKSVWTQSMYGENGVDVEECGLDSLRTPYLFVPSGIPAENFMYTELDEATMERIRAYGERMPVWTSVRRSIVSRPPLRPPFE